jgi:flavin reductase (DIM6/NTAB) family NADH-FMN oxidoreductase RutF
MRRNFGAKPYLYPQPVLIIAAYDEIGKANAMNAAWGGISESNQIRICLSKGHKTLKNILATGAFSISVGTVNKVVECDYFGIVSGNDEPNKLEKAGFTISKSGFVNAPIINELPFALECRLISYDKESCQMIGEIVNVSADESIITDEGIKLNELDSDALVQKVVRTKLLQPVIEQSGLMDMIQADFVKMVDELVALKSKAIEKPDVDNDDEKDKKKKSKKKDSQKDSENKSEEQKDTDKEYSVSDTETSKLSQDILSKKQ